MNLPGFGSSSPAAPVAVRKKKKEPVVEQNIREKAALAEIERTSNKRKALLVET